jgi:hypothetical protein
LEIEDGVICAYGVGRWCEDGVQAFADFGTETLKT